MTAIAMDVLTWNEHRQRTMGTWGMLREGELEESPRKERKSLKLLLPCIDMSKLLGISIADYKILWSPDLNTHKCLVLKLDICGG